MPQDPITDFVQHYEKSLDGALKSVEDGIEEYRIELFGVGVVLAFWIALVLLLHRTPLTAAIYTVLTLLAVFTVPASRKYLNKVLLLSAVKRRWNKAVHHCNWGHPNWGAGKPGRLRLYDLVPITDETFTHSEEEDYTEEDLNTIVAEEVKKQRSGKPLGGKEKIPYVGSGYRGKIRLGKGLACPDVTKKQKILGAEMGMRVSVEEEHDRPHIATVRFLEHMERVKEVSDSKPDPLATVLRDEDLFTR